MLRNLLINIPLQRGGFSTLNSQLSTINHQTKLWLNQFD